MRYVFENVCVLGFRFVYTESSVKSLNNLIFFFFTHSDHLHIQTIYILISRVSDGIQYFLL